MPFPDADALAAYISSLNIIPAADLADRLAAMDLGSKVAAAQAEWERRTGWRPFLASGTPTERIFDPPNGNGVLSLHGGALSIDSLFAGVTLDSAGTEQVEGRDFFPEPPPYGWPYTALRFPWGCCFRSPNSVVITADWGFTATLPADVREACLQYGAWLCAPQLSLLLSGGVESLRVLSSEVKYGSGGALSTQAKGWIGTFEQAVCRYMRVVL